MPHTTWHTHGVKSIKIIVADAPRSTPDRAIKDIAQSGTEVQRFGDLVAQAAADVVAKHGLVLPALNGVCAAGLLGDGRTAIEVPVDLPAESLDVLRIGIRPDDDLESAVYNRVWEITGEDSQYDVEIRTLDEDGQPGTV